MAVVIADTMTVPEQVHDQAQRATIAEATRGLVDLLPRRLAAYVVGVRDVKTLARWLSGTVSTLHPDHEARLRMAYEIVLLLDRFDAPETVRAWFVGMSPYLDDRSAADALHDGQLVEALDAALSFAATG